MDYTYDSSYEDTTLRIPEAYRPLSPWAYVGYSILFVIPVVGFILLLVFAITSKNINLKNFARSYFCGMLIALLICIALVLFLVFSGTGAALLLAIQSEL